MGRLRAFMHIGEGILFSFALAATLLSGCTGDVAPGPAATPPADTDPIVRTADGGKPASTLTANDTIEAPEWRVGDWFGHHVYLQDGPTTGRHYNTVVYERRDSGWLLAPDDPEAAKEEASWDLPVAGFVGHGLTTTAFGATWDLFHFPLHHGKTWDGEVQVRDMRYYELVTFEATFSTTFDAAIPVNGALMPGFRVTATDPDGSLVLDASYIPGIRWYGHLDLYDPRTPHPDDFFLRTLSMGHGTDWHGTYHVGSGSPVTEHFGGFVAFAPTAVLPQVPERFTVTGDAEILFGVVFAYALAGASAVVLVDPENGVHETRALHPVEGNLTGARAVRLVDEAAIPGDWHIASAGAAPVWVAGAHLHALQIDTREMR